jgi:hypothetical protein
VRYDPGIIEVDDLLARLRGEGIMAEMGASASGARAADRADETPGESRIAEGLAAGFRELDLRLARGTNGVLDLRTAVPLGLLALAVREVVSGRAAAVPWYALAWYAFDSFAKLHYIDRR